MSVPTQADKALDKAATLLREALVEVASVVTGEADQDPHPYTKQYLREVHVAFAKMSEARMLLDRRE